jgi:hypothetical protein
MNAAVRAVVRAADAAGIGAYGIRRGYAGLIEGDLVPLDARAVSGILHLGGTWLGTARSPQFRTTEGRRQALKHLDLHDAVGGVVTGLEGGVHDPQGTALHVLPSEVALALQRPEVIVDPVGGADPHVFANLPQGRGVAPVADRLADEIERLLLALG